MALNKNHCIGALPPLLGLQNASDHSVILIWCAINPFTAGFSDALHNASEKTSYQITHTIYPLEAIHKLFLID